MIIYELLRIITTKKHILNTPSVFSAHQRPDYWATVISLTLFCRGKNSEVEKIIKSLKTLYYLISYRKPFFLKKTFKSQFVFMFMQKMPLLVTLKLFKTRKKLDYFLPALKFFIIIFLPY